MSGGAKAFPVGNIIVFGNDSVHRIDVGFGIEGVYFRKQFLPVPGGLGLFKLNYVETLSEEELQLLNLGFSVVVRQNQLKSNKINAGESSFIGRQGPYRSRGGVSRMTPVGTKGNGFESSPVHNAFTAYFEGFFALYRLRNVPEKAYGMGDVLANDAVVAAGDGLLEFSLVISKNEGQTVKLPGENRIRSLCKCDNIFRILSLLCGEHGLCVLDLLKAVFHGAACPGRGRVCKNDTRRLFQFRELVKELVVLVV